MSKYTKTQRNKLVKKFGIPVQKYLNYVISLEKAFTLKELEERIKEA